MPSGQQEVTVPSTEESAEPEAACSPERQTHGHRDASPDSDLPGSGALSSTKTQISRTTIRHRSASRHRGAAAVIEKPQRAASAEGPGAGPLRRTDPERQRSSWTSSVQPPRRSLQRATNLRSRGAQTSGLLCAPRSGCCGAAGGNRRIVNGYLIDPIQGRRPVATGEGRSPESLLICQHPGRQILRPTSRLSPALNANASGGIRIEMSARSFGSRAGGATGARGAER